MSIVLVKCINYNELKDLTNSLLKTFKLMGASFRYNNRKNEIVIDKTKFRFVTVHQNIDGIRYDRVMNAYDSRIVLKMINEEILQHLKRVDELELKLTGYDKETLQWLIFGYNECAKLLNEEERKIEKLLDYKRGFLKLKDKLNKIEHFIDCHATDFDDGRWNLELTEIELSELQKIIKEV